MLQNAAGSLASESTIDGSAMCFTLNDFAVIPHNMETSLAYMYWMILLQQELLCSKKRRMRTFKIHSEIISDFLKSINESMNESINRVYLDWLIRR